MMGVDIHQEKCDNPLVMEKLFNRSGVEFNGTVQRDDKGRPGYYFEDKCYRCGGAGGYVGWPGFTCFRCHGNGKELEKFIRLYNAEQLAKLNASKAKRDAKKEEKRAAEIAARDIEIAEGRMTIEAEHGALIARARAVADKNVFIADILSKLNAQGRLSDKQLDGLESAVARVEAESAKGALSAHVGTVGERIKNVPVEVIRVATFERASFNRFAGPETVFIVTMSDASGNQFVSKTPRFEASVGDKFNLTATVKSHDEYKGTKQTVVERVKQS